MKELQLGSVLPLESSRHARRRSNVRARGLRLRKVDQKVGQASQDTGSFVRPRAAKDARVQHVYTYAVGGVFSEPRRVEVWTLITV